MIWLQSGRKRNTTYYCAKKAMRKVSEKCYGLSSGAQHLQILICGGTGCKASSSQGITDNLLKAIEKNGITGKVEVITVGCFGFCEKGPIVKIIPDNTFYTQVTPEDAEEIINEHIIGGRRIKRLALCRPLKRNIPSATPNTWTSTGSNSVSPCATAVLSIPKISKNTSPAKVISH